MPVQETYFDEQVGAKHVKVVKSYDSAFAREVLNNMDQAAQEFLSNSFPSEAAQDAGDIPSPSSAEFADYLWAEIEEGAREDWNKFSYFVVTESVSTDERPLFVSADWPTAEAFAKARL